MQCIMRHSQSEVGDSFDSYFFSWGTGAGVALGEGGGFDGGCEEG